MKCVTVIFAKKKPAKKLPLHKNMLASKINEIEAGT